MLNDAQKIEAINKYFEECINRNLDSAYISYDNGDIYDAKKAERMVAQDAVRLRKIREIHRDAK